MASRVLDPLGVLDLHHEHGAAVLRGELLHDRSRRVAVHRRAQDHAAPPGRKVLHGVNDGLRFIGVAHHRQHDGVGAGIEGAGDVPVVPGRRTDDGRQLGRAHECHDPPYGLDAEAAVLGVEDGEVATRMLEDVADSRGIELEDEVPGLQLPLGGHFLQG